MTKESITVKQLYPNVRLESLNHMIQKNVNQKYWRDCLNFYLQVKEKDQKALSQKQHEWMDKIEQDLLQETKKLKAEEDF